MMLKRVVLFFVLLTLLLAGTVGHQPWKPDEAYSLGLVHNILRTGDTVVPTLGGEPFMEKPIFFYTVAAHFARLFSPVLPLHDGARLAAAFFAALAMLFVYLAGREVHRDGGIIALLLFCGSVGLLQFTHLLVTDNVLMAGIAVAVYGGTLAARKPVQGGFWLGFGGGMAFMGKGLIGPGFLGLPVLLLPVFVRACRTRRFLLFLAVAALAALPWLLVWPVRLYRHDPELFNLWFWYENFGRFTGENPTGPRPKPFYFYPLKLLWFAFPAWLYALAALHCKASRTDATPKILPLLVFLNILLVLGVARTGRELYLMPAIPPLCVCAAAACLSRRMTAWSLKLTRFVRALTLFLGVLLWGGWGLALVDYPPLVGALQRIEPGYDGLWNFPLLVLAVVVTLSACYALYVRTPDNQRFPMVWLGLVVMVWGLAMTLWLPFFDSGKSYKSMFDSLAAAWPLEERTGIVGSRRFHDPQHALLDYYLDVRTIRGEHVSFNNCTYFIARGSQREPPPPPPGSWSLVWEGNRPGDVREFYRLFRSDAGCREAGLMK